MQRITALDSIRGLLLAWMAIDHWGGPISAQLYQRLGFWTAAEGFFLISGYVATQVALEKTDPQGWFLRRGRLVWKWHLIALALMALLALLLPALGWRPLAGLDGSGHLRDLFGAAVLLHQPDYLDVLPLYVVLLFVAGAGIPALARRWPSYAGQVVLGASVLLWLAAQFGVLGWIRAPLPAWMRMGLFDPMGWQLLFFAGAGLALMRSQGVRLQPSQRRCLLVVSLVLAILFLLWRNDALGMVSLADESVWTSRAHLGPLRLLSFLAVAVLVAEVIRRWPRALDWAPTRFLGQHSLAVFSLHLPLIYLWHFRPGPGPWIAQVMVPLMMLGVLFVIARAHQHWSPAHASAA